VNLKNFKVTVTCVEGPCSRAKAGTVFYVKNARLEIPDGQSVCLFALGSILAPLIAASVPTDPENNILKITREFQCPDPLSKVIYRVEDME